MKMDNFSLKLLSSIDKNAFKAYINLDVPQITKNKHLNATDLEWDANQPKRLRTIVLDTIIQNWHECPRLKEITNAEDRIYMLDNIDVNLPIKLLSTHIKENVFWKRCFINRWPDFYPDVGDRKWITVYMEKHFAETVENLDPCDYDPEEIQAILDICAPYVVELDINYLQPSMGEKIDHIPFDYILANLPELRRFQITYDTKTIETEFFLGCSSLSRNDVTYLCRGLQKCYDLLEFNLHSCKLEPFMLKSIARSLEKGASNLETMGLAHCRFGDNGLAQFLSSLSADSFSNIRKIVLTNNFLSQQSALWLGRVMKGRQIEYLDLRMNPIGTDGSGVIISAVSKLPLQVLNLSACSITKDISRLLLRLLIEHKTLINFDISNNNLGPDLGKHISQIIGYNKIIRKFDIRNTEIPKEYRNRIFDIIFLNREKL